MYEVWRGGHRVFPRLSLSGMMTPFSMQPRFSSGLFFYEEGRKGDFLI